MSFSVALPAAQSDAVEHADWIEIDAIESSDGSSSYEEFASQIHISGSTDTMHTDDDDEDIDDGSGVLSYEVADRTWIEIERRERAGGGDDGFYPFEVISGGVTLKNDWQSSGYIFQLLLSAFGKDAGPPGTHGERIFENLSSHAGRAYFGGTNDARRFRFGSPRPDRSGFATALSNLCKELGNGRVKTDAAFIGDQKDSHLDVVVWRPFPDLKESQLIGFGQCATGKNWPDKLTELQPANFATEWLSDRFTPDPIRMFFVPKCIQSERWNHVTVHAGLLFDRCRISHLAGDLDGDLLDDCLIWSSHVIDKVQGK